MKKIITIILAIAILIIAGWFYKAFKTVPALPAYEHDQINLQGQRIKLADLKGSYVLVSYFQTWCGTCIQELPSIDALQHIVGKDNLKVLMVSDEPAEKIARFKERYCNTLDYYRSDKPLNELSIRVFPTTYLLDKDGMVIMSKLNAYDWSSAEAVEKCSH